MDLYSKNYNMLRVEITELRNELTHMSHSGKVNMSKASMLGLRCDLVLGYSLACVLWLHPQDEVKKSILSKPIYRMNAMLTNIRLVIDAIGKIVVNLYGKPQASE